MQKVTTSSFKDHKPVIAVFDFDGTITTRDTLVSFLIYVAGKWTTLKKLAAISPALIDYLFGRLSRQKVKEIILTRFFSGMPVDQLRELGHSFAQSTILKQLIRPEARKRILWHRQQKHQIILISASIDAYLDSWGKQAGFDHVICSKLEVTPNKIVTGHLRGLNCWGPEKKRRLEELLGPRENYILYAYGDSQGDSDLLSIADYPFYKQMP